MSETFRLRVRPVRMKNGGADVRIFRSGAVNFTAQYIKRAQLVLQSMGECAGFAIVAWGHDGSSVSDIAVNNASSIPAILVPDFVCNKLLAQKIEDWTIEELYRPK